MKKRLLKIIGTVLCVALIFSAVPFAASAKLSGIYVTADDILNNGTYVIQNALNVAAQQGSESNVFKVTVEPGSYDLTYGLKIYDNTCLSLYGVTLTRSGNCSNMFRLGEDDAYDSGVTGYHYKNVSIEGGVFDGSALNYTMIKVAHAKNFLMKDVRLQNNTNAHLMEVAGVDGFTATSCSFLNQVVNSGTCYEALQFDILKKGNINGVRSEDLSMKNVLVEGCVFENCPRGVGSHTAVHNNPHNSIIIRNNTFKNMTSAAVQTLGWTNSSITGNTVNTSPRAFAVYSIVNEGYGTVLPSEFAAEGNTTQHYSDSYQAIKSNILIANNYITNCGSTNDPAGYEKAAINVLGSKVENSTDYNGSGKLPKGDYSCDTVTVKNNLIYVKGSGIRVEHSKTITVDSNVIFCTHNNTSANYYGIVFRDGVNPANIIKNYISNAEVNGLMIENSLVNYIKDNEIYTTGKYGMGTYNSTLGIISNNDVRNTASEGISILSASKVNTKISENRVSTTPMGIHISGDSSAKLIEKNLTYNCTTNIGYASSTGLVKLGTNYTANAAVTTFSVDAQTVNLKVGECWRIGKIVSPVNAITTFSFTNSDSTVTLVDSTGRLTAKKPGTAKITVKSANGKGLIITVNVTAQPVSSIGDANGDGYVTAVDSGLIGNYTSRCGDSGNIVTANSDVTGDGKVTAADRIVLTRCVNGCDGFTSLPHEISGSASNGCAVSVGNANADPGETFEVAVNLDTNPGIATADFDVEYDDSVLELIGVEDKSLLNNAVEEHSDDMTASPYRLSWANDVAQENDTSTGELAILTFKVMVSAKPGVYGITVNQSTAEVYDSSVTPVPCSVTGGGAEVTSEHELMLGDVDMNGVVDVNDACLIQRHIAQYTDGGKPLIDESDEMMMQTADVNFDYNITVGDVTAIQQFAAGIITAFDKTFCSVGSLSYGKIYAETPQPPADGSEGSDFNADTVTADEIYEALDALCEEYPRYFSKETLGKDASGSYDWNRYVFCGHYYNAWQKRDYPKMYAWTNGSAEIYSCSVSPRIGDVMYSTAYLGTEYGTVSAVDNPNRSRTVGGAVFTRHEESDVEPTIVYTSLSDEKVNSKVYSGSRAMLTRIASKSEGSFTATDGNEYLRYPMCDRDYDMRQKKVIVIGANEHGMTGDPRDPAIITTRLLTDLCECFFSDKGKAKSILNLLRRDYMIVACPIINPWGFNRSSGGYGNVNKVNINRNYDTPGWSLENQTDGDNWGSYGGSEIETQYFMNTITGSEADIAMSYHALGYAGSAAATAGGVCNYQYNGISDDKTNLKTIAKMIKSKYALKFTSYGGADPSTTAKSPAFITLAGALGGIIEMQPVEKDAEGTLHPHTALIEEANYTLMLNTLYLFMRKT